MATIKTRTVGGQRRIITKVVGGQRRVSCSCCAGQGCCMYPAEAFINNVFTIDDLPDEVKVAGITYTKVGSPYTITTVTESFEVYYEGRLLQDPEVQEFIAIANFAPNQWTQGTILAFDSGDCLIDDFNAIQDTFEDTYEIDVQNAGQINELSRNSLCVWGGAQSNYLAYYDGNDSFISAYYNGPPHKWIFIRGTLQPDESGGVWEKDSPQNGPEGTYSPSSNAGDFAGIGSVTVSPA